MTQDRGAVRAFSMAKGMANPQKELRSHNFSFGYQAEDNKGGGGINKRDRNQS